MENKDLGKTSMGMQANLAALLSYVVGIITGVIFYLLEKENKFVRFHAMQSIVTFGALFVAQWVLTLVPILGLLMSGLLSIFGVGLWVVLMVKAYQGEKFKLPWAGDVAEKNS